MAKQIIDVARSQLGVAEQPLGSNMGPLIRKYKAMCWFDPDTPWPWCVAFWQWCVKEAFGKPFPYRTAAVERLETYARQHRLTTTTPKVGDAACFNGEHITFLERFTTGGAFTGLGGNQSNRVQRNTYTRGSVSTWVSSEKVRDFLGVKPPKPEPRPKFEVVRGEGGQKVVIATAGSLEQAIRAATARVKRIGRGAVTIRKN